MCMRICHTHTHSVYKYHHIIRIIVIVIFRDIPYTVRVIFIYIYTTHIHMCTCMQTHSSANTVMTERAARCEHCFDLAPAMRGVTALPGLCRLRHPGCWPQGGPKHERVYAKGSLTFNTSTCHEGRGSKFLRRNTVQPQTVPLQSVDCVGGQPGNLK